MPPNDALYAGWVGDEHRWYGDDPAPEILPRTTGVVELAQRVRTSSRFLGTSWDQPGAGTPT